MLRGIETGAVLDGIHEHLAKSQSDRVSLFHREVWYFLNELNQPVGCLTITASDEFKNLRRGGKNLYAFIPNRTSCRQENHLFKRGQRIWLREITEGPSAHRGYHIGRRALRGDDDEPHMRPHNAHLAEKLDVLPARRFFARQNEIVGLCSEHFERRLVVGCEGYFPGRKDLGYSRSDFGVGTDHKSCFLLS